MIRKPQLLPLIALISLHILPLGGCKKQGRNSGGKGQGKCREYCQKSCLMKLSFSKLLGIKTDSEKCVARCLKKSALKGMTEMSCAKTVAMMRRGFKRGLANGMRGAARGLPGSRKGIKSLIKKRSTQWDKAWKGKSRALENKFKDLGKKIKQALRLETVKKSRPETNR